jgi:hypothetical protein
MPPLDTLKPPAWSRTQLAGMLALRVYLVGAMLLLGLKIGQIASGH